jgi:hypothetical protein
MWGTVCWICGHDTYGKADADHVVRVLAHGPEYYDPANLRPAHGTRSRCPECGRACNQQRKGSSHDGLPVLPPLEIETQMARLAPHCDGCRCRERLLAAGELRQSRCW